jgi:LPS-assembly lipoprotein
LRPLSRLFAMLFAVMRAAGCSFHLRGQEGMRFNTIYLETANPGTLFIKELRRSLEASKVKMASSAQQADVVLNIVSEIPDKQILSLSSSGTVNEFQLFYRVSLRAYDLNKHEWIPAEELVLHRDFPYDVNNVLAMEAEESILYQSMRTDMVQQIVLRLSRAKPQPR